MVYYSKTENHEWFSITIDNDEFGQSVISKITAEAANKAIEKASLGEFEEAGRYIDIANDFDKALKQGIAHEKD